MKKDFTQTIKEIAKKEGVILSEKEKKELEDYEKFELNARPSYMPRCDPFGVPVTGGSGLPWETWTWKK